MLRGDDRAVSETVGATILFGFLVVTMSIYQSTAVPAANEEVEFQHSQEVQADLLRVHGAVGEVAATGTPRTVSVALGTQYPQRTFFVNPPDPSGRLSTTDARQVGLINAEADGEAGDFWRAGDYGDVWSVARHVEREGVATREAKARATEGWWLGSHRAVEYHPNYHADTGDWRMMLEPPGFYSEYDGTPVQRSSRSPVDGRRIRLVLVNGSLSTAHANVENVDVRPVSADTRTVGVEGGNDDPIVLHYPTELPKSEWATILGPETVEEGGHIAGWNYYTHEDRDGDNQDYVYLVLEEGVEYDLSLAKVGVGSGVTDEPPQYAVGVVGDGAAVPEDGSQRVTVEVRDGYNAPVGGVEVEVTDSATLGTVSEPGDDTDGVVRTDEDGRATFVYRPDGGVDGTRADSFTLGFDGPDEGDRPGTGAPERVEFDVEVRNTDGSGGGSDDTGSGTDGGSAAAVSGDGNAAPFWGTYGVELSVTNDGGTTATLEAVAVDSPGTSADELKENNGGNGPGLHEIHVSTSSERSRYEAGDKGNDRYTLGRTVTLSSPVDIAPGGTVEFRFREFRESGSGNSGSRVDMQGESVHLTLRFADGTERTLEFSVGTY